MDALKNLDAERAVIGAAFLDSSVISSLGLQPGDFYRNAHRLIFEAVLDIDAQGKAVDYLTVGDYLQARGNLDLAGGNAEIVSLSDNLPTAANASHYAQIVRERAARRRLLTRLQELGQGILKDEPIAEISAEVARASELGILNHGKASEISTAFEQLEKYQSGEAQGYLSTGFDSLDRFPVGPDEQVIIGARPSIGKTALALSLAERMAIRGDPVLFISIEMAGEALHLRRLAAETSIPMIDLRRKAGIRSQEDWNRVAKTFEKMKKRPFHVLSGSFKPAELVSAIRAAKSRHGIRAVFLDHLGLVSFGKSDRRDLDLGYCTAELARLSKDLGITIFTLCQLNRAVETRDTKKPRLADLRDSGRIEEDGDQCWLLYRQNRYENVSSDAFEVIVGKSRNGPCGVCTLRFAELTGRFTE